MIFQAVRTTLTLIFLLIYMSLLIKTKYTRTELVKRVVPSGIVIGCFNLFMILKLGFEATFTLWFLVICAPAIVLFVLMIPKVTTKEFFSGLLAVSYCLIGGLIGRILYLWHHSPILYIVLEALVYVGITYFLIFAFCKPYRMILGYIENGWLLLCFIPSSFFCNLYFLVCYPTFLAHWEENIPAVIFTILSMLATFLFIYQMFRQLQEKSIAEEASHVLAMQVDALKHKEDKFEKESKQIRIYRHDMRHFANIIESHLKNGYVDEAISTIEKMYGYIEENHQVNYCENLSINAVISYYVEAANNQGIDIKVRCNLAKELPIDELEFSVVISNAMENAMNACLKMGKEMERKIDMKCISLKSQILLSVSNTYANKIQYDEALNIPISKEEDHGYGSRSIAAFVHKYKATLEYQVDASRFELRLVVNITSQAQT